MKKEKPSLGYILKGYPRISETFISNEILRLEELGMKITIFPMRKPRENFSHDSVKKIRASVHYLPTNLFRDFFKLIIPNLILACKTPRRYAKASAIACRRFRRTKKIATFKHLFQAGFLVNNHLYGNTEIDHLHGHFAHSPTSVTMFASVLSGLPFSFTAHAKDIYTSNPEQLKEKIDNASFVATCTRYNADFLRNIAGNSATPVYCIYHGIDTSLFSSEDSKSKCSPPYRLLTVARMTEKKGLPTLYQALAKLNNRGIDFTHTLIGDGDDREKILALIKSLGLEKKCRWLGTKSHEEVLAHFRTSDIFVLGCQIAQNGDRDGIPNVLVESLAMGVPALSTDVSAIPELIIDNKTGKTVPAGDVDTMAEGILLLLQDSELRKLVIKEGRDLVRSSFDNTVLTRQLADIFIADHAKRTSALTD